MPDSRTGSSTASSAAAGAAVLCGLLCVCLYLCVRQGVPSAGAASRDRTDWPTYNNGYDSQRYSPLHLIDKRNVASLVTICSLKIASSGAFQAGPLVIDGTIYVTTAHTTVALAADTCAERWRSDYVPATTEAAAVNRGAAFLEGRIFRGTGDARLLALDARTGTMLWRAEVGDAAKGESLTAAPIAWQGRVFIGTSGGDLGVKGRMLAFDAATGRELWHFDMIPTGAQPGTDSWEAAPGVPIGGGATWSSVTLDVSSGELFVPTGNPAPDLNPAVRPGKNLYTNSMLVLDAKSGALKWWYQLTSPDGADHDLGAAPLLYGNREGRRVAAMAGKDGYVYAVDRGTRKVLFRTAVTTISNEGRLPTRDGIMVCPGMGGGTKWNGPAFDPVHRALYVAATDWCSLLKQGEPVYVAGRPYWGGSFEFDKTPGAANGWITALDADSGKIRWRYRTGSLMSAALTPTAGGVLFTGDTQGNFLALDSDTGEVLMKKPTGGAVAGGVITYRIEGRQYVAFTSGNISRSTNEMAGIPTLIVMGLADRTHPPQQESAAFDMPITEAPLRPADAERGRALYSQSCVACHGADGTALAGHSLQGIKVRLKAAQLAEWIKNPQPPMPRLYPTPFGSQDVVDIAAYVENL